MGNNTNKEKTVVIVCLKDKCDGYDDLQFILTNKDYEIIKDFISSVYNLGTIPEIQGLEESKVNTLKEIAEKYIYEGSSYYNFLYRVFSFLDISLERYVFEA